MQKYSGMKELHELHAQSQQLTFHLLSIVNPDQII